MPLWITFSYAIGAYSLWGGGFLWQRDVIDYSGGYVIHLSSGTAGFVAAHWVGPRLAEDREDSRPNNILCVLIGAGILWIGWNGFNGGGKLAIFLKKKKKKKNNIIFDGYAAIMEAPTHRDSH